MVCMSSNAGRGACHPHRRTHRRPAGRALVRGLRGDAARGARPDPARRTARRCSRNIALAESLGATVVRVKADRPADGLIAFAKREGITHVIFGQSARDRAGRSC